MSTTTQVTLTAPASGAYLAEVVPFEENGVLSLMLLWEVPYGTIDVPLQVLQYDTITSSFSDDTSTIFSGAVPSLANPRNVTVVDLTGSGNPDFIIAEQGLDQAPWPGATDTLFLSNAAGLLTDASANLPQTLAYSHDVSSGAIDAAGDVGVFVNNIYSQPDSAPYYLIGNGDGTFRNVSASYLPASLQSTTPTYTSSALVDVNGDGLADLIVGSSQQTLWPSLIYLNPGNGDFADVTPIDLPASPLAGGAILDIQPIHISSPNYDDLVVVSTNSNYSGYAVQLLINDGSGHFTDETASRMPRGNGAPLEGVDPNGGSYWILRTVVTSFDGNGPDIVIEGNTGPSEVFINNGSGDFYCALETSAILGVATIDGVVNLIEGNSQSLTFAPDAAPKVTAITYSDPGVTLEVGQTETITLTLSEPVSGV